MRFLKWGLLLVALLAGFAFGIYFFKPPIDQEKAKREQREYNAMIAHHKLWLDSFIRANDSSNVAFAKDLRRIDSLKKLQGLPIDEPADSLIKRLGLEKSLKRN